MERAFMDKRVGVAHLIGSTGLYGAERWILALMRAVDPGRISSVLVNLSDTKGERSEVVEAACQRGLQAFDFYTGGSLNPFSAIRLAKWIREKGIEVIHGHGFKSDAVGLLTAKLAGCRIITTPHGWSLEKNRKLQLYETLDRKLFRSMDFVCPLSPELANGIKGLAHPSKLKLIYNGVDIDEVQAAKAKEKSASGAFLIGYVGQLIERKDLLTLFAAIKRLVDEGADARLLVLGDGGKRQSYEEACRSLGISDRTEFLGFRLDAACYLKTLDLFVLPSLMEGIPRCVMEAMAASVPVIVSDIPGNRELVTHGETGFLFAPGDSSDLAGKIKEIMAKPGEARRMATSAFERVENLYSSWNMAREYTALYEQLTKA